MAGTIQCGRRSRKDFGKIPSIVEIPNLIEVQKRSYETFLQKDVPSDRREEIGLQAVFKSVFPIADYNDNALLEFDSYHFGDPKYTVEECHDRGMTFAIPLKVTLRLVVFDHDKEAKTRTIREQRGQEVYLGELPLMTDKGTFIINGTERVVVSQLQRSAGVFFDDDKGKTLASGKPLYSARVIPYRGSWVEFDFDANDLLHVRVDRRRKMYATAFLRAFWFLEKSTSNNPQILADEEILGHFYESEDVLGFEEGNAWVKLSPDAHEGVRVAEDVKPPRHREPIVTAGKTLTAKLIEKLVEANVEKIAVRAESLVGRRTAARIVDAESGEVLVQTNAEITSQMLSQIMGRRVAPFKLLVPVLPGMPTVKPADKKVDQSMYETLARDHVKNPDEALVEIYRKLRPGDPPTVESARALFRGMFMDPRRYDLARVGRFMINKKLQIEAPLSVKTLRSEDIVAVIRHLLMVKLGSKSTDDIDHLGNRRVRSVGELLENQFRVGLTRMERAVKERMSISDITNLMPHDLINAKPVSAVVKEFFGSSQLSQFMDQTNPLAELTHKRRLSALGPRGLSRERAGFEVRDVHPTHYGRICPIETPEGPNIGLISSLSTYARTNEFGFIETPYRKVVQGRVTDEIVFLTALEEEQFVIAQANAEIDRNGRFVQERVSARKGGEFRMVPPEELHFMDVSPKQLVSVAASLIPFLENDDANRALMGSNMQRQAVPLLQPEAPLVGTGMEHVVARDSGAVVVAKRPGVVEYVAADRVVVRAESRSKKTDPVQDLPLDIYNLTKYRRSNQNTCINQKPIVRKGQRVAVGEVIADGPGTDQGELALGRNVLVAFMPWGGYNFEDAILVSERLVKDDRFTSIHIEEFEIQARDTKLGKEEVTRDIPNVAEEALKDLDESGIVRIGAKVKPGDILVGKITPKGETQLTPEEKLLRAIFGEKAGDVRDTSLTVPPGIEGTVVDVKVFSRRGVDKDERAKSIEEEEVARLEKDYQDEIAMVEMERDQKLKNLLVGKTLLQELFDPTNKTQRLGKKGDRIAREDLENFSWNELKKVKIKEDEGLAQTIKRIEELAEEQIAIYDSMLEERIGRLRRGDDLPPGVIKMVKVYVAVKRKLSVGDKMAGRHGNKGVVSKVLPEEDMPYLPDGTPVEIVLNPLGVPSRMNVGQILETHLGWAARALGLWVASPVFDGATEEEIKEHLTQASLPTSGKTILYDGRTGRRFHQEVTVGQIYILKLAHLVDDKMHARSIGPYSLVTQQPLGGKAQFGGQRFGEMEVWALEAYGAAHTLQEMLTVKSDDVEGRNRIYEAIVKGENFLEPGTPESFNVLVKELQSLALDVELITKDGKKAS
ncbi:MAG: DNA-directed RNA polymerase subunit beta [Candidatus Rokuibacteriota bacterium]|nr:MAG: DNA-directed RNA polymerase subunit beta [Candidatus Rokubacteria bacterium]PYM62035.1 MAG: DNA-directed RNA polymerase subunit beta [Candidatus Rokubacteria bacterium]PYN71066.1 MAG: DNA-directed RNA polymerase subunit beta [Candidatus Rokubacteria bacterium]